MKRFKTLLFALFGLWVGPTLAFPEIDPFFVKYDKWDLLHPQIIDIDRADTTQFEDYTDTRTGCACWFDPLEELTEYVDPASCACCKNNGTQCGYPMHTWCQASASYGTEQTGCEGAFLKIILYWHKSFGF